MSTQHYNPDQGETSEEVTMLSGKGKYYRRAVPLPFEAGIIRKKFWCICGGEFKSQEAYELHYRRAYKEEKMIATEQPK